MSRQSPDSGNAGSGDEIAEGNDALAALRRREGKAPISDLQSIMHDYFLSKKDPSQVRTDFIKSLLYALTNTKEEIGNYDFANLFEKNTKLKIDPKEALLLLNHLAGANQTKFAQHLAQKLYADDMLVPKAPPTLEQVRDLLANHDNVIAFNKKSAKLLKDARSLHTDVEKSKAKYDRAVKDVETHLDTVTRNGEISYEEFLRNQQQKITDIKKALDTRVRELESATKDKTTREAELKIATKSVQDMEAAIKKQQDALKAIQKMKGLGSQEAIAEEIARANEEIVKSNTDLKRLKSQQGEAEHLLKGAKLTVEEKEIKQTAAQKELYQAQESAKQEPKKMDKLIEEAKAADKDLKEFNTKKQQLATQYGDHRTGLQSDYTAMLGTKAPLHKDMIGISLIIPSIESTMGSSKQTSQHLSSKTDSIDKLHKAIKAPNQESQHVVGFSKLT